MTLAEFVLARVAEDEATAINWSRFEVRDGIPGSYAIKERVLAECEAKRQIVAVETSMTRLRKGAPVYDGPRTLDRSDDWHPDWAAYLEQWCDPITDTRVLRWLALPYAAHEDYQEDWRPRGH